MARYFNMSEMFEQKKCFEKEFNGEEDLLGKLKQYHKRILDQNAVFLYETILSRKKNSQNPLPYGLISTNHLISIFEEKYYVANPAEKEKLNTLIKALFPFFPKNI
jgi:hypothetical protein